MKYFSVHIPIKWEDIRVDSLVGNVVINNVFAIVKASHCYDHPRFEVRPRQAALRYSYSRHKTNNNYTSSQYVVIIASYTARARNAK